MMMLTVMPRYDEVITKIDDDDDDDDMMLTYDQC